MKLYVIVAAAVLSCARISPAASVEILPTPGQGIQPRALVPSDGSLHLVWYQGSDRGGDVWYAKRIGGKEFSEPVRVNSEPGTAVAAGTIRGAQAVIGKDGRVHVVWNGAMRHKRDRAPLYYTRLAGDGKSFEPQRAMSGDWIMDGGGAVAADSLGHVHVFYHGGKGDGMERSGAPRAGAQFRTMMENRSMPSASSHPMAPASAAAAPCRRSRPMTAP